MILIEHFLFLASLVLHGETRQPVDKQELEPAGRKQQCDIRESIISASMDNAGVMALLTSEKIP